MKLLLLRTVLIYLCVLFAMRMMGKRQLGELQPEELVSTMLISNLASISIESEDVRGKDIYDPRDVSYAVIETNGSLSVARRPDKEPATLADLGIAVQQAQATVPLVVDGQVLEDNLRACGKDRAWLEQTARANAVAPGQILILLGNDTGDYFLLKKESRPAGGAKEAAS